MSLRKEFAEKAVQEGANMSALCRAYNISRPTGYKWRDRYLAEGVEGLRDRSRRPHHSPNQTPPEIAQKVLKVRHEHPTWGGRKINRVLKNQGHESVPAPSTITEILRRNDELDPAESAKREAYKRFEKDEPNEMWQMDFKGDFALENGQRCHPLTVLDDHSRFAIGLQACRNETHKTVKSRLTAIFRTYGLPQRILVDNGPPWSDPQLLPWTRLSVWLLRLGVPVSRSSVNHPQTLGKDERFHRTLVEDVLNFETFSDFPACQQAFDQFRQVYNTERPHEARNLDTPADHYQPSSRPFPEHLPPLRFPAGAAIRKVGKSGRISYQSHRYRVGKAFYGQSVGILHDEQDDGTIHIFFNDILVRSLDLRTT